MCRALQVTGTFSWTRSSSSLPTRLSRHELLPFWQARLDLHHALKPLWLLSQVTDGNHERDWPQSGERFCTTVLLSRHAAAAGL
jgi:hypothetical protein